MLVEVTTPRGETVQVERDAALVMLRRPGYSCGDPELERERLLQEKVRLLGELESVEIRLEELPNGEEQHDHAGEVEGPEHERLSSDGEQSGGEQYDEGIADREASDTDEIAQLRQALEDLGIPYDGRWKAPNLRKALEDAQAAQ